MGLPQDVQVSSHPGMSITSLKPYENPKSSVTAVVSPGNSLGLMNGGLDKVLRDAFSPNHAEKIVGQQIFHGYSPPGSARIVQFDKETRAKVMWDAEYLIHMPTMRSPRRVHESDLESLRMVYDWTWSILSEVEKHNSTAGIGERPKIGSVILSGLATGYGKIPYDVAGKAMIAAIAIFYNDRLTDRQRSFLTLKFLKEDTTWIGPVDVPEELKKLNYDPLVNSLPELFFFLYNS
ncbi:hypothetical protein BON22_2954 [Cyberlindnera fabianii]|uniref:Macro domain-containing protein n=1 Tax=Cyberlindnera fabianii TaxID=36022 RepID=A0A1V2L5M5_CYBFA|nr:hypothetical protein BON22_2954 [Cyberlindnera fabianii]